MTNKQNRHRLAVFIGFALGLTGLTARAQTQFNAPPGYLPGWWINVQKAGQDLGEPQGARLVGFAAPAAGFDMASYRDQAPSRFDFGLAYDATGALNLAEGGVHQLAANVTWSEDPGAAEAHCALSMTVEGKPIADWRGPIAATAGTAEAKGDADLPAGLHPVALKVACDQPLGGRVAIAVRIKGPSESDPRPIGPTEIIHPGEARPAVAAAVAPRIPPPAPQIQAPAPRRADAAPATIMVAAIDLGIHQRPDRRSPKLGRLVYGQEVRVLGPLPDPAWTELADGGYVESGFLKPPGAAGPARPGPTQRRPR